ncbi:hypothetical protein LCGC14_1310900 [marine sediment metagenome]|uniref:RelA/SpoT domain-containing protein n=1 Tax=marine sediment metagenome TaxID=412755 RepID=A0A0F9N3K8_9ZZZZ
MKEKRKMFIKDQLNLYKQRYSEFINFNKILEEILHRIAKPISTEYIMQKRVKSLTSFTEKILRQPHFKDPITEMTDICGIRIIFPSLNDVKRVSTLIKENFIINPILSRSKVEDLDVSEFGYRSDHYSIILKKESSLYNDLSIPESFFLQKAEIQVRTIIEHAYAAIYHDLGYKGAHRLKKQWEREFHRGAALLEQMDESFSRIELIIKDYETNFGGYLNENEIKNELEKLQIIHEVDPENADIAYRMALMAKNMGDWSRVVNLLSKYTHLNKAPILRELGFAIWRYYKKDSEEYQKAESYLKKAIQLDPLDWDAMAILGGYYKDFNEDKARECYKNAFDINPHDAYSLGNYLIYELRKLKNLDPISISKHFILDAIERCNTQIELEIDIPWAYYNKGLFNLFLGNFQDSFINYILGVRYSNHDWVISTTYKTLNLLSNFKDLLPGLDLIQNLLLLSITFKYNNETSINQFKSNYKSSYSKIEPPVVILIGSTRRDDEELIDKYQKSVIDGFKKYEGTLISGGTLVGVTAFGGEIQELYGKNIKTIGYLPKEIPDSVKIDNRYNEIRYTDGLDFTIKEAISYWLDIWASNIQSKFIKSIGIGGGNIAKLEYYLTLLFNTKLGILKGSGRSADLLMHDPNWKDFQIGKKPRLKLLENTEKDIDFFVNTY